MRFLGPTVAQPSLSLYLWCEDYSHRIRTVIKAIVIVLGVKGPKVITVMSINGAINQSSKITMGLVFHFFTTPVLTKIGLGDTWTKLHRNDWT